jgi:ribonuclease HI
MPRLDDFAGFFTRAPPFNPFSDVVAAAPKPPPEPLLSSSAEDDFFCATVVKEPLTPSLTTEFPFFRESTKASQAQPQAPPVKRNVPMDQPRGKDGERLLYTYPNLPTVKDGDKEYSLLVGSSDKSATAYLMQFDGAANPNPGPASSGAVLWSPKDAAGHRSPIVDMGKFLGKATNNIAEIQGLLLGLKIAAMRGARDLLIEGDSELIIRQQTREYKVSNKNLKSWWAEIQAAMMDEISFDWIAIRHVRREFNERADSITKEVLSKKEGFTRC